MFCYILQVFLIVSVVVSACIPLLLMVIPPARVFTKSISENVTFDLICSSDTFFLRSDYTEHCSFLNETVVVNTLRAENCGFECKNPVIKYPKDMHDALKGNTVITWRQFDGNEYMCHVQDSHYEAPQKCFSTGFDKSFNLFEVRFINKYIYLLYVRNNKLRTMAKS